MGTLNASGDNLWAEQDKDEQFDYSLDWSDLLAGGDTIASSTWNAEAGVTLTNQATAGAITSFWVTGGQPDTWYRITNTVTTAQGRRGQRTIMLFVKQDAEAISPLGSALFPNRFTAVAKLRKDRLMMLANSIMPDFNPSDEYLWEKLLAAESTVAGVLRVPLAPTHFFPKQPTDAQVAALNGAPWAVDPAYDYDPANYQGDRWGFVALRQRPVQQLVKCRMVYPSPMQSVFDVPNDWLRVDAKYGHMQIVPTASPFLSPLGGLIMSNMAGGRLLPFAIELEYVAGLQNAGKEYPELLDAVQKLAVTKIVDDGFMPQSGSISADGLSQSVSVDVSKYHDAVDTILNGPAGGNGGLVARINGVRMVVM